MILSENIWKIHMNRAEQKTVQDVAAGQCHHMGNAVAVRCHLMDTAVAVAVIISIL
jgi:hypothetical protein